MDIRQERLEQINYSLFNEFMKRHKNEQEELTRVNINLAAYQMNTLNKEKQMWEDIIQINSNLG